MLISEFRSLAIFLILTVSSVSNQELNSPIRSRNGHAKNIPIPCDSYKLANLMITGLNDGISTRNASNFQHYFDTSFSFSGCMGHIYSKNDVVQKLAQLKRGINVVALVEKVECAEKKNMRLYLQVYGLAHSSFSAEVLAKPGFNKMLSGHITDCVIL
ncbi:unnamed protein product [Caenorhabditis nigoni]|nr:hypothetical protein B9Z55_024083 [Caenorhabditis nigoni]